MTVRLSSFMKEPQNSWEVSYVISIRKPHIDTKITREELVKLIRRDRLSELRSWADRYFCHKWFLEHV